MAKVRNNAAGPRGLCAQAEIPQGQLPSPGYIDRVMIDPGQEVEVDGRFLETDGAKEMLESGDLEIVDGASKGGKRSGKESKSDGASE